MTYLACYSSIEGESFERAPCTVEKLFDDGCMLVAVAMHKKRPDTGISFNKTSIVKFRAWPRGGDPTDLVCGEKSPTPDPRGALQ